MENFAYLNVMLPHLPPEANPAPFLHAYRITRLKRFLALTALIFMVQYLSVMSLTLTYPALPLYPPLGIAFILFYLVGFNAAFGLLLAGGLAYFLQGYSLTTIALYLAADVGGGYVAAYLCQNTFSPDIKPFTLIKEWYNCILLIGLCSLFTTVCRTVPFILSQKTFVPWHNFSWHALHLWLADVNAMLMLSCVVFSWLSVPFGQSKIKLQDFKSIPVLILGGCLITMLLMMKKFVMIYFLGLLMLSAIYASYRYGYLVSTALCFIISSFYLSYFAIFKKHYLNHLGQMAYTSIGLSFMVFILMIIYTGSRAEQKTRAGLNH